MVTDHLQAIVTLMAFVTFISSGVAVYVSLKVRTGLNEFQIKLVSELDQRYVRTREFELQQAGIAKEEIAYRSARKEKLEDAVANFDNMKSDIAKIREIADRIELQLDAIADTQRRHK